MQQIADWLEKLGMSEYAQRFAENDIDIEVLGELTDSDFDRLGVSLGPRRKLLKALAAGVPTAATPPPSSPIASFFTPEPSRPVETARPILPSMEVAAGERRHVTVMFCDLVDSTGIAARLDAEEWRDLVTSLGRQRLSSPQPIIFPVRQLWCSRYRVDDGKSFKQA
jgi:hypothetical protein